MIWIDIIALLPLVLLVMIAEDPVAAFARLDPFLFFRLFVLVWVIGHVILIVRRFVADLRGLGDLLVAADAKFKRDGAIARIGRSVLKWTMWRVAGLMIRHGWSTVLMVALVTAVNLASALVLAGRL